MGWSPDVAFSGLEWAAMTTQRARAALSGASRHALGRIRPALVTLKGTGSTAPRILFVPQDLSTADPVRAREIAEGYFAFASKPVSHPVSPFQASPPSDAWVVEAAGFSWLRHLKADTATDHGATARRFVTSFLDLSGPSASLAWEPAVTAERLRAFLSCAGLILRGTDDVFYGRFSRALLRHVRLLEAALSGMEPGVERLRAIVALVTAGLCLDGEEKLIERMTRRLDDELARQILPDGGHVSRHPLVPVTLVLDLLPLRQLYPARNAPPPRQLMIAIDRMIPMIRMMRHTDGSLARFNGMGPTPIERVVTALAYDESRGSPPASAPHTGYERLEAGPTVVVMDVGSPPPLELSGQSHAGALSFEMSCGRTPVIINCGLTDQNPATWREHMRKTAAHSTLTVADASSCRFDRTGRILAGPRRVSADRRGTVITAVHDGYEPRFGVTHSRTLALAADGLRLDGEDRIDGRDQPFALRFHLHPSVQVYRTENGRGALLVLPGRDAWGFTADHPLALEESVSLAQIEGPRRTTQIVIAGSSGTTRSIAWTLRRLDAPLPDTGDEAEADELPL